MNNVLNMAVPVFKGGLFLYSVVIIIITLSAVVVLMHRKVEIGHAMLAGSILLTALTVSSPLLFFQSVVATGRHPNTWEILVALFFVMCLEFQLRTSGLLDGLMSAARSKQISDKVLLAGIPAFLGFLPSMGGALFSAPMVENASRKYKMSPEQKTTVNYWFRHIWEFVNPITPSLLLVGQITHIALPDLIGSMGWFVVAAVVIGWIVCLSGLREVKEGKNENETAALSGEFVPLRKGMNSILLTAGPILLNLFLVVALHLAASASMAIVVMLMILVLKQKFANVRKMFRHGMDKKLLWGVGSVLLFQQVLQDTGILGGVVDMLETYRISPMIVAAALAFSSGILTGTSSGFVALSMPIIVALAPGDIATVTVGFVVGTAGQMLSPMHLCFLVTLKYFRADFTGSIKPIAIMEMMMIGLLFLRYGVFSRI